MVADTRQIEEDRAVDLVDLTHFFFGSAIEVRVVVRVNLRATQIVVPVRTRLNGIHVLAGNHRDRARRGLLFGQGRGEQVLVVIGPGLEIVVELGQIGVIENVAMVPHLPCRRRRSLFSLFPSTTQPPL